MWPRIRFAFFQLQQVVDYPALSVIAQQLPNQTTVLPSRLGPVYELLSGHPF
jgi:hypothetical protein